MPRALSVATVGVVSVSAALGLVPSASAAPAPPQSLAVTVDVVGDSYMAGDGVGDVYLDPADPRQRSTGAPTLQALSRLVSDNAQLEVDANIVAASGAEMANFFDAQTGSDNVVVNPAQRDQVRPDAQFVIVGFGGEDAQLATVIANAKRTAGGPNAALDKVVRDLGPLLDTGASDEEYVEQAKSTPMGQAPTLVSRMLQVVAGVRARAPQATIVVTNYPLAVDPQNPHAASTIGEDDLTTVRKFGYDLNKAINRAVQICQCASLVDVSGAMAGHEAYTTDSAFNEQTSQSDQQAPQTQFQPNEKGASLIANPIADSIAQLLSVTAPAPSDGRMTTPNNIGVRGGVSDRDGDRVSDAEDRAPDDPSRSQDAPAPGARQPRAPVVTVDVDGLPGTRPGSPNRRGNDDPPPRVDGVEYGIPARDETLVVGPVALPMEPAAAPPEPGGDPEGSDEGVVVQASVVDTPMMASLDGSPVNGPATADGMMTLAAVDMPATPPAIHGPAVPGPANPAATQQQQTQTPPMPVPSPIRGYDIGETPIPEFSLPGYFGDAPNRENTMRQLNAADYLTQFTPNNNNPVTVDTAGTATAAGKAGKGGGKANQSAKAVRDAENGTAEFEVTSRDGVTYEVPGGIAKYSNQDVDRTSAKVGPQSLELGNKIPNFSAMQPGDSITRTPAGKATEYGLGRPMGKVGELSVNRAYEGPSLTYTVKALGDGLYSLTYGDTSSDRSRFTGQAGAKGNTLGNNVDSTDTKFRGAAVVYDAKTPEGLNALRTARDSLENQQVPVHEPGTYYTEVSGDKTEGVSYAGDKVSGKAIPGLPEGEAKGAISRTGVVTTNYTLMRSVDGDPNHAEPVGYTKTEISRLGTGGPFGDVSVQVGDRTVFGGDSVPVDATIRSVKDSGVNVNEVSFRALGQNYTLSQGDMIQRARDLAVNDPETVANNRVLSDLADGIGVQAAMTDPPGTLQLPGFALTNKDINDALTALVTPPVPERNPLALPPDPERNPFAAPPLPERAPQDVTPPLPERRADVLLGLDPEQQAALDDADMFTEVSFDSQTGYENTDTEALSDPLGDTTPTDAPSVTTTDDTYGGYAPSGDYSTEVTGTVGSPDVSATETDTYGGYAPSGDYSTGTETSTESTTTDSYGGYAPSGGDYSSYSSSDTGTDSSTTSYGGDGGVSSSMGGDTSTSYGGGDSGVSSSMGGDTSTSYGGGDSGTSTSYGGSDSGASTSSDSSSSSDGSSTSAGDGGGF